MKQTSTTRFTRVVLSVCMMLLPVFAQAQTITLSHSNAPLETVLKSITDQTGYKFVYAGSVIDTKQTVSVNVSSGNINTVLDAVFKDTGIAYRIADKQAALSLRQSGQAGPQATAGTRRVTGRVTNQDGSPLVGASVIVEGSTSGTVTDVAGVYTITIKDDPQIRLTYRCLGLETRTVTVGPRTTIDISLMADNVAIDQVVVTGYQTISKARSAGSYAIVSGGELQESALAAGSVLESLEGTAAGLSITLGA